MTEHIGILHPGEMGISVAASAQNSGHSVYWVSAWRSPQTRARAHKHALVETASLAALCQECSILISVCPPHAAEELADCVLETGFQGVYADVNAISPERVVRIGEKMAARGTTFVDGGIIGGPAWQPGETWLYLSGRDALRIANCFTAGPLATEVIGEDIGRASALKMCYAGFNKGRTALLCAILGAAEGLGVREELERQWNRDESGAAEKAANQARRVTAKAWRFAGEMDEIAATLDAAGLPGGFHLAAAEIYRRLVFFKGRAAPPELNEVLAALREA